MGHTRSPWVAMFCHLAHPRAAVPAMAALLWLPNNVRGWESSPLPNTLMASMSMQAFCLLMTVIFLYIFMICSCDFPSFVHICVILYSSIRERIHTREVHGVLSHSLQTTKTLCSCGQSPFTWVKGACHSYLWHITKRSQQRIVLETKPPNSIQTKGHKLQLFF